MHQSVFGGKKSWKVCFSWVLFFLVWWFLFGVVVEGLFFLGFVVFGLGVFVWCSCRRFVFVGFCFFWFGGFCLV